MDFYPDPPRAESPEEKSEPSVDLDVEEEIHGKTKDGHEGIIGENPGETSLTLSEVYPDGDTDTSPLKGHQPHNGYTIFQGPTRLKDRVIGMLDMDAFEVQIYLNKIHDKAIARDIYNTKPCILADPTTDRIISVNHLAKDKQISREDRVTSAKVKCPDLIIIRKEIRFNKPENYNLRHATWALVDTVLKYRREKDSKIIFDFTSNDEFFVDLTEEVNYRIQTPEKLEFNKKTIGPRTFWEGKEKTFNIQRLLFKYNHQSSEEIVANHWDDARLLVGVMILEEIRKFIFNEIAIDSSGGVSTNKLLTKLAVPLHKPGGLTILPAEGFSRISEDISFARLPTLGRERGKMIIEKVNGGNPMTIAEFAKLPLDILNRETELGVATTIFLRKLAHGIHHEPVVEKLMKASASMSKANLKGSYFYRTKRLRDTLVDLYQEYLERIEEEKKRHQRIPDKTIHIEFYYKLLPVRPEDRGQPPKMVEIVYPFVESLNELTFLYEVLMFFLQKVRDLNGVVVKITFVVRNFVPIKHFQIPTTESTSVEEEASV